MTRRLPLQALTMSLILLAIVSCSSDPQPTEFEKDFSAYDLDDNLVRLSDYQGKIVVLNFWATWCAPCRWEMPALEQLYNEYRDRDVVLLSINVSESASEITAFAQEWGLTFPILRDTELEGAKTFGIRSLPTTFLIDRKGKVRMGKVGMIDVTSITQQIEDLL